MRPFGLRTDRQVRTPTDRVRATRPGYTRPSPGSTRRTPGPGCAAGPMIPSRTTGDLLAEMWELLEGLGEVPRRLVWDKKTGIGAAAGSRPVSPLTGFSSWSVCLGTKCMRCNAQGPVALPALT